MPFTNKSKIVSFFEIISIASDKNSQNYVSMKTIKVEQNDLDKLISTEINNSNKINKVTNLQ